MKTNCNKCGRPMDYDPTIFESPVCIACSATDALYTPSDVPFILKKEFRLDDVSRHAIRFHEWVSKLSPSDKCTVHPSLRSLSTGELWEKYCVESRTIHLCDFFDEEKHDVKAMNGFNYLKEEIFFVGVFEINTDTCLWRHTLSDLYEKPMINRVVEMRDGYKVIINLRPSLLCLNKH